MSNKNQIDQLVGLAMECELVDPIDWGLLAITELQAYQMMASNVLEQIEGLKQEEQLTVAMATMTKMLVENFVLNLRLKGAENVLKGV